MRISTLLDSLAAAGALVFGLGLWLVYPPLAVLFAGGAMMTFGVLGARVWAGIEAERAGGPAGRGSRRDS